MIIKGKFVSGAGDSFTMDVTQTNFHGRALVGKPLTLNVDEKTRFVRRGPAKLSDFKADDRLNVQARACKKQKNAAPSAQPAALMLAKRVVGRPANPAGDRHDDNAQPRKGLYPRTQSGASAPLLAFLGLFRYHRRERTAGSAGVTLR